MALDKDILYKNLLRTFKGMAGNDDFAKGVGDACAQYLKLGQVVSEIGSAPPGSITCDGSLVKATVDPACATMGAQPPETIQYTGDEILATAMSKGMDDMMSAMQVSGGNVASATMISDPDALKTLHDGILDTFEEMKKKPEDDESDPSSEPDADPEPPRDKDEIMAEGITDAFTDYLTHAKLTVTNTMSPPQTGPGKIV